ncbi:MAG: MFS transporter, partial [Chloroflexi bacterium]|nr:MFS transporter [Chloroflexota bacterium]
TRRRGLLYLFSILGTGIALLGFSASHWYPESLAIVIGVGLGQAGRMSLSNILIQESTDDAYRGRVMGVYNMEWGLTSLSSFGVALLAGFIGVQWAIGGMAALLLVAALYYLAFVPSIRRLS